VIQFLRGAGTVELPMAGRIVVGLAILTLSTSAALAAHRAYHSYYHPMNAYARMGPPPGSVGAPPAPWMGGISSKDHEMYLKNLHDSGYNPKNDYVNGIMRTQ
jgi:hypothetical protein